MNAEGELEIPPPEEEAIEPKLEVALRERILRQFERWLDEVLAGEAPPQGLTAGILAALEDNAAERPDPQQESPDLYSLWSALTALTQEVKLQGRTFKQLTDTLSPLVEADVPLHGVLDAHAEALAEARAIAEKALAGRSEREREGAAAAERRAVQEMLKAVLDLRDRLARGLQAARQHLKEVSGTLERNWLRGLLGHGNDRIGHLTEAARAFEKGYVLTLDRLDEVLGALDVQAIDCAGQPFDPRFMNAVDVQETSEAPEGTVLEVYRPGYVWKGEIFRQPEVKVARAPSPVQDTEKETET
jgi:molecular chaperone GrpE